VDGLATIHFDVLHLQRAVVSIDGLRVGMILDQHVSTKTGTLVASSGQELTSSLLVRMRSCAERGTLEGTVAVLQRRPDLTAAPKARIS
jgi:hypothetical protein